jgi:hypothetical protein
VIATPRVVGILGAGTMGSLLCPSSPAPGTKPFSTTRTLLTSCVVWQQYGTSSIAAQLGKLSEADAAFAAAAVDGSTDINDLSAAQVCDRSDLREPRRQA